MFALDLFKRRQRQYFAQLDLRGHCVALWELDQPPASGNWVRVHELDPRWIGRPLPAHAVVAPQPRHQRSWRLQHA
ncbi:hypothetical protein [Halopseudomonas sabulinigri]|uniref:Uncharacterized protein n=1 Tax=Halopseudomonas sabulinigri TaxID=472181 RepID=A0A1H1WBJ6_9GAMM|nr:hypothetical protein [Halopseudomonas sabulinigri]SDS94698.1 hypothetical protein SAMN05216271_3173 [Halopseudomonas sabulinigri]